MLVSIKLWLSKSADTAVRRQQVNKRNANLYILYQHLNGNNKWQESPNKFTISENLI